MAFKQRELGILLSLLFLILPEADLTLNPDPRCTRLDFLNGVS